MLPVKKLILICLCIEAVIHSAFSQSSISYQQISNSAPVEWNREKVFQYLLQLGKLSTRYEQSFRLCKYIQAIIDNNNSRIATLYQQVNALGPSPGNEVETKQHWQQLQQLTDSFEQHQQTNDSIYALMLHKVGLYKNAEAAYQDAIQCTYKALRINLSARANCSSAYAAKNFYNIGKNYEKLDNSSQALLYYDSAANQAKKYFTQRAATYFDSYIDISRINWDQGNYQEALNAAELGLLKPDTNYAESIAYLNLTAARAATMLKDTTGAKRYLAKAWGYYEQSNYTDEIIKCVEVSLLIATLEKNKDQADGLIKQLEAKYTQQLAIETREGILGYIASSCINVNQDYIKARVCYLKILSLYTAPGKNGLSLVSACNNLGLVSFLQHKLDEALLHYHKALNMQAYPFTTASPFTNPTFNQLKIQPGKQYTFQALRNKAELLMLLYRRNRQPQYINASVASFQLADSLLTDMRNTQTGEESKLYWRNETRNFYQQALEMCSAKNDSVLAYSYMEKSRAVLLNDHLNEVGAGDYIPANELKKEQLLNQTVLNLRLQISALLPSSSQYYTLQQQLLDAEQNQQHFRQQLEISYPAYYRYKYSDGVVAVDSLQQYLRKNNQQWVQYFVSDTLLFVLHANGKTLKFYRQVVKNLEQTLHNFVESCASRDNQDGKHEYDNFLQASYHIYDTLLGPLHLQPGRLIVSPDNAFIPFDALCSSPSTQRWMVKDFAISYAYSARLLLKPLKKSADAKNNFFGMAPVFFPVEMHLPELKQSAAALQSLKTFYLGARLLTGSNAKSKPLLNAFYESKIVNLYTHASGSDTAEPRLYLADTTVRLSELQTIQQPATELVVLSACQTHTGRLASGEGVLSLARGFIMAGIPATVATLWNADENATYGITHQFHYYLSQGLPKDSAMQMAKLYFMHLSQENEQPFYWANLTLTGSADPINLKEENNKNDGFTASLIVASIVVGSIVLLAAKKRKGRLSETAT